MGSIRTRITIKRFLRRAAERRYYFIYTHCFVYTRAGKCWAICKRLTCLWHSGNFLEIPICLTSKNLQRTTSTASSNDWKLPLPADVKLFMEKVTRVERTLKDIRMLKKALPVRRRRKFRFIFQHVFALQQSHFLRSTPPLVPNIPICRLPPLCEYNKIKNLNNFFSRILSFLSELCTCIQKQIKTVWCLGASFFLLKNQFTVNFFFFSRRGKKKKQTEAQNWKLDFFVLPSWF